MPTPQVIWTDLISHIASRMREIESSVEGYSTYEPFNPYWDYDEVEQFLLEISQRTLRDITPDMLQSCGSAAVQSLSGTSITLPQNTIAIMGAQIQFNSGDTYWRPAKRVGIQQWFQTFNAPVTSMARYAILQGGAVAFAGNAIHLVIVVEPTLDVFQADTLVLPPASYDEERVEFVCERLQIQDFSPEGTLKL